MAMDVGKLNYLILYETIFVSVWNEFKIDRERGKGSTHRFHYVNIVTFGAVINDHLTFSKQTMNNKSTELEVKNKKSSLVVMKQTTGWLIDKHLNGPILEEPNAFQVFDVIRHVAFVRHEYFVKVLAANREQFERRERRDRCCSSWIVQKGKLL